MARKRKKLQGLDYNSTEYWNRLLAQDALSMDQGRSPKQISVGGNPALVLIEEYRAKASGRKLPKPQAE